MFVKFVVVAFAITACNAAPFVITAKNYNPGNVYPGYQTPSIAYGYGSGFSSNIAGIRHSVSHGHSFQIGDGEGYGAGFANSDGAANAQGIGIASTHANPARRVYNIQPAAYQPAPAYNSGWNRNYGSAVSSAQNIGNAGSAVAHSNSAGLGNAVASASNHRGLGYGSAVSSANSNNGFGSAISSANNSGYGSAVSSAQTRGALGDYSSAVSASENVGGVRSSTAQAVQQTAGSVQHSGATSIDGPGVHAAYSHAVNNRYY
ncbi:hypothetical protein O3G_MSEX014706 [Manduca sexta]|uniref:Fibroin heavy chain-like n=1 Tax=Manduca sexta TaxID=7130 RepID=A0A922D010_MANSE|nr:hypothetical protein O3G_MSEX014706 [Manduca sexta]